MFNPFLSSTLCSHLSLSLKSIGLLAHEIYVFCDVHILYTIHVLAEQIWFGQFGLVRIADICEIIRHFFYLYVTSKSGCPAILRLEIWSLILFQLLHSLFMLKWSKECDISLFTVEIYLFPTYRDNSFIWNPMLIFC